MATKKPRKSVASKIITAVFKENVYKGNYFLDAVQDCYFNIDFL